MVGEIHLAKIYFTDASSAKVANFAIEIKQL